ncbi:hypothetical protein [Sulfurimonas sp.]|uniref:hypothetical protein n=1 Tax=Sulfurimonas sp. TaxID=2022749 RepID=UPI00356939E2
MSLSVILTIGIILSIAFHFVGVYAGAKKTVWVMIVIMWAGSINIAMSEVKPAGYEDIKKMQGQFADTDQLIAEAGDKVSVYEMLKIKKSYQINNPKK